MYDIIMDLLKEAWDWVKKIWVKVVNWVKNIVQWFKDKDRLRKIKEDKEIIVIVLKEKLKNGDFNTMNVLFNEKNSKITDAQVIHSEELGKELKDNFGNKDMLVLS